VSSIITSDEALWYLLGLGLDSRVHDSRLEKLRELGKLMRWGHRAEIARRNPDELTLLLSGSVDIADGHHRKTLRLKGGDLFGFTTDSPGDVRLQAYDDTLVCNIQRLDFENEVAEELGNYETRAGLRPRVQLSIPVGELLYRPASARMAYVLQHLAEQGTSELVEVKLKPRHLASLAGIAPSHSRALYDTFQKENLIETSPNGIVIPDIDAIRDIASKRAK